MAFYKRSVFLINPKFQIKFSVIVCSLVFLSSLIYPIIFIDFFDELLATVPNLDQQVISARNNLILYLILIQAIFTLMVFILFIFMTHKIAGPLYKLKNHLYNIRQGEAISPLTFRNGDHFQDVAEEVSLFLETIEHNQEQDFQYLDEVSIYVQNLTPIVPDDKRVILEEISRRLKSIKSRYKTSV